MWVLGCLPPKPVWLSGVRLRMSLGDRMKAPTGNISKWQSTNGKLGLGSRLPLSSSASVGVSRSPASVPSPLSPELLLVPRSLFICLSISLPWFLISKPASYYRKHNDGYTCLKQYYCLAYCFVKYFGGLENERCYVKWKSILILNKHHRFKFPLDGIVSCSRKTMDQNRLQMFRR